MKCSSGCGALAERVKDEKEDERSGGRLMGETKPLESGSKGRKKRHCHCANQPPLCCGRVSPASVPNLTPHSAAAAARGAARAPRESRIRRELTSVRPPDLYLLRILSLGRHLVCSPNTWPRRSPHDYNQQHATPRLSQKQTSPPVTRPNPSAPVLLASDSSNETSQTTAHALHPYRIHPPYAARHR